MILFLFGGYKVSREKREINRMKTRKMKRNPVLHRKGRKD